MIDREPYVPGPASGAQVRKDGEMWTLFSSESCVTLRKKSGKRLPTRHIPHEWAFFDADGSLGTVGARLKLTTVGAPISQIDAQWHGDGN